MLGAFALKFDCSMKGICPPLLDLFRILRVLFGLIHSVGVNSALFRDWGFNRLIETARSLGGIARCTVGLLIGVLYVPRGTFSVCKTFDVDSEV